MIKHLKPRTEKELKIAKEIDRIEKEERDKRMADFFARERIFITTPRSPEAILPYNVVFSQGKNPCGEVILRKIEHD